jgi:DNA-binding response OmpR family regulator
MGRILYVEDDPMISEIYQKKFEEAGFEVVVAASAREVLSQAGKSQFDLVLLDLVLPEMSGLEVLKELKSGKYNPKMKIIIFSNLNEKETRDEAFAQGADGFISKTQFNPSELAGEVQRMMNEYQEQKNNEVRKKNNGKGNHNGNEDSGKKILLIEDEEVFVEMFGNKLESDGFEVKRARNGAWGLKEAMAKKFDLIITDMVMPAMNGEEIVEKLKMEEKTKDIPIIMLSASISEEEAKRVKELGITDFFIKTKIIPSDLSKRVKKILGE